VHEHPACTTLADLQANPNCTTVAGAGLGAVLEALPVGCAAGLVDLRKFVLVDSMHTLFLDGLLDKIVSIALQVPESA